MLIFAHQLRETEANALSGRDATEFSSVGGSDMKYGGSDKDHEGGVR